MPVTLSKAQVAKTTSISIGSGGTGETFTPIGEIKNIDFSGFKNGVVDVTNMTTSNGVAQKLATILDYGQVKVTANRVSSDAGQAAVLAAMISGALTDFKVTVPMAPGETTQGDVYVLSGIVAEFMPGSFTTNKEVEIQFTIDISGVAVLTVGS
jgi:hypothetical protein